METSRFKAAVKDLVARGVARLPWGIRQRIFEELLEHHAVPHDLRYDALVRLAEACRVQDFTVLGNLGPVRGSARDASVLKQYALRGTWADRATGYCRTFFAGCSAGLYIDVGANIGLTVIPVARLSNVRCVAIEAEPTNFAYLQENISRSGVREHVSLRNVAVFSRPAALTMEIAPSNLGDHRIRPNDGGVSLQNEDRRPTVTVDGRPLDDIVSEIDPEFPRSGEKVAVKIDVQGAEPFVFEGGQRVLREAGLLIVEFSPYCMARMNANPEPILQLLQSRFRGLRIAHQEEDAASDPMPIDEAVNYLRDFAKMNTAQPCAYLDIIADH
jgi:FkbM family methyltransferase